MSVSLSLKPKNSEVASEGDQTCATAKEFSSKSYRRNCRYKFNSLAISRKKVLKLMTNTDCYIVDIYDFRSPKFHLCRFLVRNRRVKHRQKVLIYSM